MLLWKNSDLDDDLDYEVGPLTLVFAQDVLSPYKLVSDNGVFPKDCLITSDYPPDWEHGVLIAEGEPVTRETLHILEAAGLEDVHFPMRLTRLTIEE